MSAKKIAVVAHVAIVSAPAFAGYGNMGNDSIESSGGTGDLSSLVWGALIVGGLLWLWKKFMG